MAIPFFVGASTPLSSPGSVTLELYQGVRDDDVLILCIEGEGEDTSPMAELMQQITMMNAQAQAQMAETVSNALITVTEIVSAPRQTTIINDANGDPAGSISKPILNS